MVDPMRRAKHARKQAGSGRAQLQAAEQKFPPSDEWLEEAMAEEWKANPSRMCLHH